MLDALAATPTPAMRMARDDLLALGGAPGERRFVRLRSPDWPPGVSWLADEVAAHAARLHGTGVPRECLVSCNAWLGRHTDRTAPYPCLNGLVVLRHAVSGGELLVDGAPVLTGADAEVLIFDGSVPHEVTPITPLAPDAYRLSVLYYLPLPQPTGGEVGLGVSRGTPASPPVA